MYHGTIVFEDFYYRYLETLQGVDESIGQVMKYLADNGLEDNTVVIYMGDNGFSFGEHGLIDKRHMYAESMKVHLLVWAHGINFQQRGLKQMVQNIDIEPKILEDRKSVVSGNSLSVRVTYWALLFVKQNNN